MLHEILRKLLQEAARLAHGQPLPDEARLRVEQVFKFYWTVVAGLALVSLLLAWFGL